MTKANAHQCHASVRKLALTHCKCHTHCSMLLSGMSMKAYFGTESIAFHNNTQCKVCQNMLNTIKQFLIMLKMACVDSESNYESTHAILII